MHLELFGALVKEAKEHNFVSDIKLDIPQFDTALLMSNWSSVRRNYLSKIPKDINALSCGLKSLVILGTTDAISLARLPQKSSQHVRACFVCDDTICSKKIGDNRNTSAYDLRPRLWLLRQLIFCLRDSLLGPPFSCNATQKLGNSNVFYYNKKLFLRRK